MPNTARLWTLRHLLLLVQFKYWSRFPPDGYPSSLTTVSTTATVAPPPYVGGYGSAHNAAGSVGPGSNRLCKFSSGRSYWPTLLTTALPRLAWRTFNRRWAAPTWFWQRWVMTLPAATIQRTRTAVLLPGTYAAYQFCLQRRTALPDWRVVRFMPPQLLRGRDAICPGLPQFGFFR